MTAGAAMAAILKGRALGLDEVTSVTTIAVIKGRVQMAGAVILAIITKSGACAEEPVYWWEGEGQDRVAFVKAKRHGQATVTHHFGMRDAVRAGLTGNDTYKKYPDDMLLWRAVSIMGRRQFPDVCAGIYVPGEVPDEPDASEPSPRPALPPPPEPDPLLDELSADAEPVA